MKRRLGRGASLLTAVLLAGCGSTVATSGSGVGGVAVDGASGASTGRDGLGGSAADPGGSSTLPQDASATTTSDGATPLVAASDSSATGSSGTGSGRNSSGPNRAESTRRRASAPSGRIPAGHRAVSDSTIKIGFLYADSTATASSLGIQGYSQANEPGEFKALVDDVNAHGGVAGRKLQVVYREFGAPTDDGAQANCVYFTQDEPVFMVFTGLSHYANLNACLAKGDVGFTSNYLPPSDAEMRRDGPIYAPDDIALERYVRLLGQALTVDGFFRSSAKPVAGILRVDTPIADKVTKDILRPILANAGIPLGHEERFANDPSSAGDTSGAMFRMKAAGVTHIISYYSPLLYMTAAESQGYRPAWALSSNAGAGSFLEGAAPAAQLANSGGPGWMPVSDLNAGERKKVGPVSTEETRCLKVLAAAGFRPADGGPGYTAQMLCGEVFHFRATLSRATEVSTAGFRAAAERLTGYVSPMAFGASYAGGRHDGADTYRYFAYQSTCSCFRYTGSRRSTPAR